MTDLQAPALPEFNPFDPDYKRDPYATWQRAREATPVFFSPVLDMWVVTRHRDIVEVLRDPATFSSARTIDPVASMPPEVLEVLSRGRPLVPTLIDSDPPGHTRMRGLCNKAFSPQRVAAMEGRIRALANSLIDDFAGAGRTDLMASFAGVLPRIVIGDIVGVPRDDLGRWGAWVDQWAALVMEDLPPELKVQAAHATLELQAYNDELIALRRAEPRDDLVTELVHARLDDGSSLTHDEVSSVIVTLLIAGHNTVADFIGNAVLVLSEHPDVYRRLAVEPELAAAVVEEILRLESPAPGLFRAATRDADVGGVHVPAGSRLFLLYASANRDEAVFPDAARFDHCRPNVSHHLAMGRGVHHCLGAPLARLEGRVALQELARRLPGLRVVPGQAVDYTLNLTFRGPVALDVEWDVTAPTTTRRTDMSEHPNAGRVKDALDAYNRGDIGAMTEHFADDILWHVGGDHPQSGDYRGKAAVVGYLDGVRASTGGTITLEPIEILASDEHAGIFLRVTATRGEKRLDDVLAEAVRFDGQGRWAEYWALAENQAGVNAFWKES